MSETESLKINWEDAKTLRKIMNQYGDTDTVFNAINSKGERQTISIYTNKVVVTTFQDNG